MKNLTQVEAVQAWLEGKRVQVLYGSNEWADVVNYELGNLPPPIVNFRVFRIRPEKKTVPWRGPTDVPSGAIFLSSSKDGRGFDTIVSVSSLGVSVVGWNHKYENMNNYFWSDLTRKEWKPCTVEIEQ